MPAEEDDTQHPCVKSSDLSLTKAPLPQKLQHPRRVESNKEAVASKTEKIQEDAPESSLLVSHQERFSLVQAGVQPEKPGISLEQTGSANVTEGSSQCVSTDQHWTQTLPTIHLLSPTAAVSLQDKKPKSRNEPSVHHNNSVALEQYTQPIMDASVQEEAVLTQRFPGRETSGALFKVPTTVLHRHFSLIKVTRVENLLPGLQLELEHPEIRRVQQRQSFMKVFVCLGLHRLVLHLSLTFGKRASSQVAMVPSFFFHPGFFELFKLCNLLLTFVYAVFFFRLFLFTRQHFCSLTVVIVVLLVVILMSCVYQGPTSEPWTPSAPPPAPASELAPPTGFSSGWNQP